MTHWNYRVIKHYGKEIKEHFYSIHEVYYDGEKIIGVADYPAKPVGENPADLVLVLDMFKQALEKPVLDFETIF